MRCSYCGTEQENNTKCMSCGADLEQNNIQPNPYQQDYNNNQYQYNYQMNNNKKSNKTLIIVIVAAVLLGAVLLGIVFLSNVHQVSKYIDNTKKLAYTDTANGFTDKAIKKVNEALDFKLYAMDTIYYIPAGKTKCLIPESGGQSPFSDKWNYAFVGVTYDGRGYNYYFIGEDGSEVGIPLSSKKEITDSTDMIYTSYKDGGISKKTHELLEEAYKSSKNIIIVDEEYSDNNDTKYKELTDTFKKELLPKDNNYISKIIFISGDKCTYKGF